MRLAVYARQSKSDRDRVPSTDWQITEAEAWAASRGHEIVQRYADADTSGYRKVARPAFVALLESVTAGEVDGVLVWRLDRLSRQGQWGPDVLKFMEARNVHSVALLSVCEDIDTSSAAGELILGVRLSIAKGEAEAISTRWKTQKRRAAEAGTPSSGGSRWFGWTPDRTQLDPVEAEAVRHAASVILAGGSLRGIVLAWNEAGVATVTGRPWSTTALRGILTSRRLCAVREHNGQIIGPGQWPAILDADTVERMRRLFDDPTRATRGAPRRTLLSGFLKCGKCGVFLLGGVRAGGTKVYRCPAPPQGCNGTSLLAAETEDVITARVFAAVKAGRLPVPPTHDPTSELVARLADLEDRLAEAARDFYSAQTITRAQFTAASQGLGFQIDAARRELSKVEHRKSRDMTAATGIVDRWDVSTLEQQRQALATFVRYVEVHPGTGGRFDPSRLKVRWQV